MPLVNFRKTNGAVWNNLDSNYDRFDTNPLSKRQQQQRQDHRTNNKLTPNQSFFSSSSSSSTPQSFEVVKVPLIDAIKPIAMSYLTGDVHFSEAARTYMPIDLTQEMPESISNIDILIDSIDTSNQRVDVNANNRDNIDPETINEIKDDIKNNEGIDEIEENEEENQRKVRQKLRKFIKIIKNQNDELDNFFGLTNDTRHNGNQMSNWVRDGYNIIQSEFANILNHNYDPNHIKSLETKTSKNITDLNQSQQRSRYIVPLQDVTTSGITHGWGGGDPSASFRIAAVEFILHTVLRPEVTNVDYVNKHTWLIDKLQTSLFSSQNDQNDQSGVPLSKSTLDLIRTQQPLMWVMHNIGDIAIDWERDVINFIIRDKDLSPVMWYCSNLDDIRAYTLPEINSWVVNEPKRAQNENASKPSPKTSLERYLDDIKFQLDQEASVRLKPISKMSQRQLEIFVILPLLCLILFGLYKLCSFIFRRTYRLLSFLISIIFSLFITKSDNDLTPGDDDDGDGQQQQQRKVK